MIEPQEIVEKVQAFLDDAQVEVYDLTGTKNHYEIVVVSKAFEGKSLIKRHRLVYDALKDEMKEAIHALTIQAYTPEQWTKKQA